MNGQALLVRLQRETKQMKVDPPEGVSCWPKEDKTQHFEAQIIGPKDTPYHLGCFKLEVILSDRYPFEPPLVRFVTPVYHPNIDTDGRICLDVLNLPPKGSWKPSYNICNVLTAIRMLLSQPNPDDGLMVDITQEYKQNRQLFLQKARDCTARHALDSLVPAESSSASHTDTAAAVANRDSITGKRPIAATAATTATINSSNSNSNNNSNQGNHSSTSGPNQRRKLFGRSSSSSNSSS